MSGGHGTRLRPLTYSQQKQLIPVANKPILFYCIEDLIDAGIDEIAIIVGPNKEQVIETVQTVKWNAHIEFIYQDAPRGLAHAVKIAKDFIKSDNFIMYLGDNLLKGGCVDFVKDFTESMVDASILLTEVQDPTQYGVALIDEQKKIIVKLIEKPKNPPTNLSIVGIYGMTPMIFEAIDHIKPSWRGELEITDALHWLIKNGYEVRYALVNGWWKDTGRTEDILEANRLILDMIEEENFGLTNDRKIKDRVKIGRNSVICKNSVVKGPVIIGENCVIEQSNIGPYTSIGNNCSIIGSEIEDSIVLEGTSISNVERIVGSLIGKGVSIERDFDHSSGKKFILGDNSQVKI